MQKNISALTDASVDSQTIQQLVSHVSRAGLPVQDALVLSNIAMTLAGLQMSMRDMQIELMEGHAAKDQETILMSQATATELSAQIQLANTQINEILSDMNSSIVAAGNVLASMSNLSQEALDQLH